MLSYCGRCGADGDPCRPDCPTRRDNPNAARSIDMFIPQPLHLDLGSGRVPIDDHLGIDLMSMPPTDNHHGVLSFRFDGHTPWPFADECVDSLYSSHLIEHLPAENALGKDSLAFFFEQAWRVAKPDAPWTLRWPSLIDEANGKWLTSAFFDPTHRRWIPREQLLYFSSQGRRDLGVESYGFECNWVIETVSQRPLCEDRSIMEYMALLRKHPL